MRFWKYLKDLSCLNIFSEFLDFSVALKDSCKIYYLPNPGGKVIETFLKRQKKTLALWFSIRKLLLHRFVGETNGLIIDERSKTSFCKTSKWVQVLSHCTQLKLGPNNLFNLYSKI